MLKSFLILLITTAASAASDVDCDLLAAKLNLPDMPKHLPASCIQNTLDHPEHGATSETGYYKIYTNGSILIIRSFNPLTDIIIAGAQTGIKHIGAVAADEKNFEVAILDDQSNSILTFDANLSGNVAPKRILRAKDLAGVTAISIDPKNDHIVATKNGTQFFYKRSAHSDGKLPEHSTSVLKVKNVAN